ncbi:hypothetical protein C8J56DRAFT_769695, partial [Mycena floridula]
GAFQLAFNNESSPLIETSLCRTTRPLAMVVWGPKNFECYHAATVKFFTDREKHTTAALAKITCPVQLVHALADVAYPLEHTETFMRQLEEAHIDVKLDKLDEASTFKLCCHPLTLMLNRVNKAIFDFVARHTTGTIPPARGVVQTPFESLLVGAGWKADDSDSDELIIH